jgi:hypothetical protein
MPSHEVPDFLRGLPILTRFWFRHNAICHLRQRWTDGMNAMYRAAARMPLLLFVVVVLLQGSAAAQTQIGFKTPSGNIFCVIEDPYDNQSSTDLRCDIIEMTSRPARRPNDCPLEWGDAFSISQNGSIGVRICHGDTVRDDSMMALPYGATWRQRGFSCKSESTGLTCFNSKGHGFMLSRAVQRVF